ncbi:MAG: hypothetical protein M3041_03310 [Acidobacteriota bacterium]|nr:hypothetical protein [Acidobacteriota bacterium]
MRTAVAAIAWLVVSSSLGAGTLFPTPLHLVRRIDDPISKKSTTLDEFCLGDRIVSISGARVAITDYGTQTLTEIDHASATYSVTRFDDIAKARPSVAASGKASVNVTVDRTVALSRDAVEAIVGAAYPNHRDSRHEQILAAAAPAISGRVAAQSMDSAFGLPTDTSIVFEEGLTYRNVVIRFDHDLPPAPMMLIDPGATRVESRLTRMTREMQQLDKLPRQ